MKEKIEKIKKELNEKEHCILDYEKGRYSEKY